MFAVETEALGRIYKIKKTRKEPAHTLIALDNVNLKVNQGELFGLLGPNGAGKTTLIKVLTTLLGPSSGTARVNGLDVARQPEEIRRQINMVSGGETSGYGLLTVRENLWMFTQFYGIPSRQANERIMELLKIVGLEDRANTKSSNLSTGLRQKMNIVRGFMTDPTVLFLDEPTLGLDVGAARDVRRFVREWVSEDPRRTLLLTTHYMVEAEEMCDRVAIINQGKILACDTPQRLKESLSSEGVFSIQVSALDQSEFEELKQIPGFRQGTIKQIESGAELELVLADDSVLAGLIGFLAAKGSSIITLHKREATLEDVFISLVGKSMKDVENGAAD
ncbi:MAG: ABC transporter ATP-binding protein [Chloroflexi bacterium]|jgi:ABC-2 type transport system ATP-binding protein|nr:ABC transporter ATP-binding protein [Anaerolineaceae bacterium]NLI44591.1 ABC transporter ATP-binding protein [Chloroflexota bacterium]HOE35375.1 ABC transporter ATP-binding protein [Anaerolineaceae bacterium]HOT26065.1 ABC transporter ATP-binding protein [Anaerolineaceae bacterium]HQH58186.1 ABC transporter ATP-binding protein [Anaerolineaceae bacterium]